jgi:hypothetical protein
VPPYERFRHPEAHLSVVESQRSRAVAERREAMIELCVATAARRLAGPPDSRKASDSLGGDYPRPLSFLLRSSRYRSTGDSRPGRCGAPL